MRIKIEIHSPWHAGSGKGSGPLLDTVVVRTPEGLPYLPGKTLKGLLREAAVEAQSIGRLSAARVEEIFGSCSMDDAPDGTRRFSTVPGRIIVGNAELGKTNEERKAWRKWAENRPPEMTFFSRTISSTAIGEDGVAQDKSLRSYEFIIPLTLFADIDVESVVDGNSRAKLESDVKIVLPLVRSLGTRRTRGFGRCTVSVDEGGENES